MSGPSIPEQIRKLRQDLNALTGRVTANESAISSLRVSAAAASAAIDVIDQKTDTLQDGLGSLSDIVESVQVENDKQKQFLIDVLDYGQETPPGPAGPTGEISIRLISETESGSF